MNDHMMNTYQLQSTSFLTYASDIHSPIQSRTHLLHTSATTYLHYLTTLPSTSYTHPMALYLDPFYPDPSKTAKSGKGMEFLRSIGLRHVNEDKKEVYVEDALRELLVACRQFIVHTNLQLRLVLKRPSHASINDFHEFGFHVIQVFSSRDTKYVVLGVREDSHQSEKEELEKEMKSNTIPKSKRGQKKKK